MTRLHRKWPSVRCACSLEGSILLNLHACACVSNVLETDPFRVDASSVCRSERERLPVPWSWECQSTLSREVLFLHIPGRHFGRVSARSDGNSKHQRDILLTPWLRQHEKRALSVLNAHVQLFSRIRIPAQWLPH